MYERSAIEGDSASKVSRAQAIPASVSARWVHWEINKIVIAFRRAGQAAIRERLERARAEGDLPAHADPNALTYYLGTVVCGMAVQAASGANREDLERVIELTMRAWPR